MNGKKQREGGQFTTLKLSQVRDENAPTHVLNHTRRGGNMTNPTRST